MGCAHNKNTNGFTLVEISIVMIIIGLLIGGTFGGMKLIENMQINKTIQDLKAIESAALTFKDTYGRLPGDMPNTAARLPSCTDAPCATGGNGNRRIENLVSHTEVITSAMEKFTFWHHLQAASLLSMDYKNSTDMSFGEGSPSSPIGGGYSIIEFNSRWRAPISNYNYRGAILLINNNPTIGGATPVSAANGISCGLIMAIDRKMDDGLPMSGPFEGDVCGANTAETDPYDPTRTGEAIYDLKGF